VEATYDLERLTRLKEDGVGLVVSHTCFSKHREGENDTGPELMTSSQVTGLTAWVRGGGALLGTHSATVLGSSDARLGVLMGAEFVSHPEQFSFPIYPMHSAHPIMAGIEAFSVHDEFYIQHLLAPVDILMVAMDRGVAYPMAGSKREGAGRVAHVAMGHSPLIWSVPMYQKLFTQAARWTTLPAGI